jgi:hydroxymethylpyrimidine pyrophosphatase-like HAD family hydrolase
MGKPFEKEIEKTHDIYTWGLNQNINDFKQEIFRVIHKPLLAVGSGGSLSACYYATLLYQQYGMIAKAISPLELFYSKSALRESNVLFISASGKNTDILFGHNTAVLYEPNSIMSLCMSRNSALAQLSENISISKTFEYDIPTGKDGFLATNSLVAFFTILYKTFNGEDITVIPSIEVSKEFVLEIERFIYKINSNYTFTILHGGWGQPVAIDLESKFAEAALANILVADYRNFGHGRHHWFDKRSDNSAIVALVTPTEKKIAEKTLSLLPKHIPVLIIETNIATSLASIDLLIKSFYLVNKMGVIQNIDPGRPGVPDFGSKLYNLKYNKFYKDLQSTTSIETQIAIVRKANVPSFDKLNEDDKLYWLNAHENFTNHLRRAKFGAIIFDYDGTICSAEDRYNGVSIKIIDSLIWLLKHNIVIGIATGRGKSVRDALQKVIPAEYWNKIIVGYYNCSDIGLLEDKGVPDKQANVNSSLEVIFEILKNYQFQKEITPELKPNQLTIEIDDKNEWTKVRSAIVQLIMNHHIPNLQVLESSHSIDIIDAAKTSKLNILTYCQELTHKLGLSSECLCIGDKGKWPGNDFQLLASPYSLSVDEVSPLTNSCWNLSKPGIKSVDATLDYLSLLEFKNGHLVFSGK